AADAGARPRARLPPSAAPARRAVTGPRAGDRRRAVPDREDAQPGRGIERARRRAERQDRARLGAVRIRPRGRADRSGRLERRSRPARGSACLLPRLLMANFFQHVVAGLANGSIYATLALALVLIHRATGILNFAQGEMGMFATYIAWSLINTAGL